MIAEHDNFDYYDEDFDDSNQEEEEEISENEEDHSQEVKRQLEKQTDRR